MQWADLLWSSEEGAVGVTAAIIEVDHVVQCCRLAVAEVRSGLSHLTKAFRPPEAGRNCLAAKIAIPFAGRIIAEVSVHVEIAVGHCSRANQGLVGRAPGLGRIGKGRKC